MAWSTIAIAETKEEFANPGEQAALTSAAGASEKLTEILARTVNMVRGKMDAAGITLGAANTIPDSVRPDVIAYARWRWLVAFPSLKQLQTEERKKMYEAAEKRFDLIATGDLPVESAVTPTADTASIAGNYGSETKVNMRTHVV